MSHINTQGYEVRNGEYSHRIIAEKALGRKLSGKELIHHIDYDRTNNLNSNLVICPDQSYHKLLHARQRILELGGNPDTHAYCSYHKCIHVVEAFSFRPSHWNKLHNMCRAASNEYRKTKGLNRNKFDWRARLNQQYRRSLSGDNEKYICLISPWEVVNESSH